MKLLDDLVLSVADADLGWEAFLFEVLVDGLEFAPEGDPGVGGVLLEVFRGEAKRKAVDGEGGLAGFEGASAEGPDFFDGVVAHGVAADGGAGAVDHKGAAGAAVVTIVGVRETEIEGEVIAAVGIHLVRGDGVNSFRGLAIAFLELGAEVTGEFADVVNAEEFEGGAFLDPEFELGGLFEDANEHGRAELQAEFRESFFEAGFDAGDGGAGTFAGGNFGGGGVGD